MIKTQPDDIDVGEFLAAIPDPRRHAEAPILVDLMQRATNEPPRIWGGAMVGFGRYEYTYASGHSGAWFLTGFRPSKARITIHIMDGFKRYGDLLDRLGPHKHAKSCLYITALARIDHGVLEKLVHESVTNMRETYSRS